MKYKNPNSKNIRGSYIMIVSCGYCKTDIAKYQKVGRGNLIKMHLERLLEAEFDFAQEDAGLFCPNCGEQLGARMTFSNGDEVYKMTRSTYNTRRENQ